MGKIRLGGVLGQGELHGVGDVLVYKRVGASSALVG